MGKVLLYCVEQLVLIPVGFTEKTFLLLALG